MSRNTLIHVEPALLRHVHIVAYNMRADDKAEVLLEGDRPARVLRRLLRESGYSRTLSLDGEIAAMFGVVLRPWPEPPTVWALTTTVVEKHLGAFWVASQVELSLMLLSYGELAQCIDARYTRAIRWVKRLGFEVEEQPHLCGPLAKPYYRATLRAKAG